MEKQVYKNTYMDNNGIITDLETNTQISGYGEWTTHKGKMTRIKRAIAINKEKDNRYYELADEFEKVTNKFNELVDRCTVLGVDEKKIDTQISKSKIIEKVDEEFIWSYYKEQQRLYPKLQAQDICRLVYAATYLGFNNGNILIHKDRTPILKSELYSIMGLTKPVYYKWLDKMVEYNYIKFIGEKIKINADIFGKGRMKENRNDNAIRVFINMVRHLYENLKPVEHYKMGLLLRLIPHINIHFNCVTDNPLETDRTKIKPMKLGELAELLGYPAQHINTLRDELLELRIGTEKEYAVMFGMVGSSKSKDLLIYINSKLFFGGTAKELELANVFFDEAIDNLLTLNL